MFARDEHRCQYCGDMADSIDHIMPRSRGGEHIVGERRRGVPAVQPSKRDRTPDEAGMRLARPATRPKELAWVTVSVSRVPEAWKPYLALAS